MLVMCMRVHVQKNKSRPLSHSDKDVRPPHLLLFFSVDNTALGEEVISPLDQRY